MNQWSKKRRIMRSYDATAHIYDARYAEEQGAKIKAALDGLRINRCFPVLDAGCGTGILFDYIARNVQEIVGVDISRKALVQAKQRAKSLENVHLVQADVDNMPLKENIFAHVFAFTIMQNVPSPTKTLNEIERVTKEDAIVVVTGMKKSFTLKSFKRVLTGAGLRIVSVKEEGLKCYVAVCTKISS